MAGEHRDAQGGAGARVVAAEPRRRPRLHGPLHDQPRHGRRLPHHPQGSNPLPFVSMAPGVDLIPLWGLCHPSCFAGGRVSVGPPDCPHHCPWVVARFPPLPAAAPAPPPALHHCFHIPALRYAREPAHAASVAGHGALCCLVAGGGQGGAQPPRCTGRRWRLRRHTRTGRTQGTDRKCEGHVSRCLNLPQRECSWGGQVLELVSGESQPTDAPGFVGAVGACVGASMGGSSGVLLEIFFRAMARALANTPTAANQVRGTTPPLSLSEQKGNCCRRVTGRSCGCLAGCARTVPRCVCGPSRSRRGWRRFRCTGGHGWATGPCSMHWSPRHRPCRTLPAATTGGPRCTRPQVGVLDSRAAEVVG